MAQTLQWSLTAHIPGGAKVSTTQTIPIEAYDSIKLAIESEATNKSVELQPGGEGQVKALIITSDHYSNDLSYKVNLSSNPKITLDQPHVFMGEGAVGLLDPEDTNAPKSLIFTNAIEETFVIEILIGRDAITP